MLLATAGMWDVATRSGANLVLLRYVGFCSGFEIDSDAWATLRWRTPLRYLAVLALLLAFAAHWASVRRECGTVGRVIVRVSVLAISLVHGSGALILALELGVDRNCRTVLGELGLLHGVRAFLIADIALTLAALCALTAVRTPGRVPRRRLRRLARSHWFKRTVAGVAVGGLLCFLPVADLGSGPVTGRDACGTEEPLKLRAELAFLCDARSSFPTMPDHLLLAYGRRQCAAYPGAGVKVSLIAPICPPAARQWAMELAAEEAEIERRNAANQAACDQSRHRPRIRPVAVARDLLWSEIGLEAFEDHELTSDEDPPLHHDLVGSTPGHLSVGASAEFRICVTTETYRRRPPVEIKGWDRVVEIGYESPTGDMVIVDPMSGPGELTNLAFLGEGHYRVRVHYREPVWDQDLPQHILVMVFPGSSDRVIAHKL
ncbi:hypothetical protein ACFXJ8_06970 [Nonomuraea sp. NPDC059194]|uniref:hypothetical protein n=1 Tax=Nonomuraea sp. NPDC059194 TaxID=3346764 RepID=UPI0036CCFB26